VRRALLAESWLSLRLALVSLHVLYMIHICTSYIPHSQYTASSTPCGPPQSASCRLSAAVEWHMYSTRIVLIHELRPSDRSDAPSFLASAVIVFRCLNCIIQTASLSVHFEVICVLIPCYFRRSLVWGAAGRAGGRGAAEVNLACRTIKRFFWRQSQTGTFSLVGTEAYFLSHFFTLKLAKKG
jgi:hypothetical protein